MTTHLSLHGPQRSPSPTLAEPTHLTATLGALGGGQARRSSEERLAQLANTVGFAPPDSDLGAGLVRPSSSAGGLRPAQAAPIHGATFGFVKAAVTATLLAAGFFHGESAVAQELGRGLLPTEVCVPAATGATKWEAARAAVYRVEAELSGSGAGPATGLEHRPQDASITQALTALGGVIDDPRGPLPERARALAERGSLHLLAASFGARCQAAYQGKTEAELKTLGLADLRAAIELLPKLSDSEVGPVLRGLEEALLRDLVVTPSEESLVAMAVASSRADRGGWLPSLLFGKLMVPEDRPQLSRYVMAIDQSLAELSRLARSNPHSAETKLRRLLKELRTQQDAGGERGLVAAQIHHSLLRGTHPSAHGISEPLDRLYFTDEARSSEIQRLALYLVRRGDPHQLAMYSTVPDELLRLGTLPLADQVEIARGYVFAFDQGPTHTHFHLIAGRVTLPLVSKIDPVSAEAIALHFVGQIERRLQAAPELAADYRRGLASILQNRDLTPEVRGLLQAQYERLAPDDRS